MTAVEVSRGLLITTYKEPRCAPVPFPGDDLPTGEFYPPKPAPERRLGALEQRTVPVRQILDREGYHLAARKRVDVNPWVWICLSGVLVAFGLALLAVWANGATADPAPLPVVEAPATAATPLPPGGGR